MKRLLLMLSIIFSALVMQAQGYIETFSLLSDNPVEEDTVVGVSPVRVINSGSIIQPIFDETCPEEMKGPFSYACKIMEEYIPPCMPVYVKVSCGNFRGTVK